MDPNRKESLDLWHVKNQHAAKRVFSHGQGSPKVWDASENACIFHYLHFISLWLDSVEQKKMHISGTGCSFQYNESRLMHYKSGSHKSRSLLSLIFLISHMIQFTKSIWRICSLIELLWFFWVQSFQWASWSSSQISLNDFFTNWTDLVFWVRSFQWVSWSSSHHQSKWFVHELDFCSFESDHFHDSRDPVSKISLNDLFTHWTY